MNCLLLSRYSPLGASSRIRFYQYLPYLHSQGIEVKVAPLLEDGYLKDLYAGRPRNWSAILKAYWGRIHELRQRHRFDLVWVEGEVFPWLPALCERWLSRRKIPYVVDYDDAAFHRYDLHPAALVRWLLGSKIDAFMRGAALVIAGNEYIAQRARKVGSRRVEILPTVVDLNRYAPAILQPKNEFVVGWIGSPATTCYLRVLEEALRSVSASGKTLLRTCGSGPITWKGVRLDCLPWSEGTEIKTIQTFDVGVMPLPETPWAQGKCGYKLIQYMACGLPVVASPVGVNRDIVRQSVNGFLAGSTEEWVRALVYLRDHPAARRQMGQAGRKDVEAQYCLDVTAPRLRQFLLEAAGT
jgi:glycosyltransferase involved in cell wall biosynthesis